MHEKFSYLTFRPDSENGALDRFRRNLETWNRITLLMSREPTNRKRVKIKTGIVILNAHVRLTYHRIIETSPFKNLAETQLAYKWFWRPKKKKKWMWHDAAARRWLLNGRVGKRLIENHWYSQPRSAHLQPMAKLWINNSMKRFRGWR